ncbi:hypothetical protein F5Y12DRAFT_705530 [Xylaria sp. FL1777]|nr:hypothetical protein F5Y12DRAFT_705530 [Xylaria sp. FL1777]
MDGRRKLGAGRPRKSCSTCKSQKIRCTEERPSCKRCVRLHHVCTYSNSPLPGRSDKPPPPPAQQGAAVQGDNIPPKPMCNNPLRAETSCVPPAHAHAHGAQYALLQRGDAGGGGGKQYIGLLERLLPELVELYFQYAYNAHLLLHKRSFLASVADGSACTHVVLSVCAWGAKFYEDASGLPVLKTQGFMLEWAQRAGKLVFQDVEELAWENVVTFMNLALFWHSQGSWRRAYLYKGNAFLVWDLLGLGPKARQIENSLEPEIRRRRFWACYIMRCHTSDNDAQFEPKGDLLKLPLPWPDADFDVGMAGPPHVSLSSQGSSDSIFAELIKASTIWYSVSSLLKSPETSLQKRIPAILALDERLQKWWQTVQPDLKLTPQTVKLLSTANFTRVLHLNSLYHQSLCALHASLVPLFCCSPGDGWCAARQLSAQIAFEHAGEMSSLIMAILDTTSRTSGVPMFTGYTAYCCCSILMPFMWCSNPAIRERVHGNITANSKLLQLMTVDWKFASILNTYIHYLYNLHSKRGVVLEDEPIRISRDKLTCFNGDTSCTRRSIYEYIAMFRTEGGGYGGPENGDGKDPGDVGVSESGKAASKIPQDSNIVRNEPTSVIDSEQVGQHAVEQSTIDGGNMMELLYPFAPDLFGLSFNDEMPELPSFDIREFDLGSADAAAPSGSHIAGGT